MVQLSNLICKSKSVLLPSFLLGQVSSHSKLLHTGLEKKNSLCCWSFLPCLVILKWPISAIVVALFWPYAEQFSPSQISFHHWEKCSNIMAWRFCLWNIKKWKAVPLGLIKFLLFNKYLGIQSVLESKRHLSYAGHPSVLMGNSSLLFQLTFYQADSHASSADSINKG